MTPDTGTRGTKKTGVYICKGCGINDALDVPALKEAAMANPAVAVVRTSDAFCLKDSSLISQDVDAEGLGSVVLAACSPREKADIFRYSASVKRVNLREHVAWCTEPNSPGALTLAGDLLAMGIASARFGDPPAPYVEDHEQRVLVVGGGPAGLSAARAAAGAGFEVVVVEREAELGGFWRHLAGDFPRSFGGAGPVSLGALVEELAATKGVDLRTCCTVTSITGQPGRFAVLLSGPGGSEEMLAGSVVMATGFQAPAPGQFAHYGLGSVADVVTSIDFEHMAASGNLVRPSDGAPVHRVAIFACDGPQDGENVLHLGAIGTKIALKQAQLAASDAEVFVL